MGYPIHYYSNGDHEILKLYYRLFLHKVSTWIGWSWQSMVIFKKLSTKRYATPSLNVKETKPAMPTIKLLIVSVNDSTLHCAYSSCSSQTSLKYECQLSRRTLPQFTCAHA